MHRQSLGSPFAKLHSNGGGGLPAAKEDKLKSDSPSRPDNDCSGDEGHRKATKPRRFSTLSSSTPSKLAEKLAHFMPILTLLCFLVLYIVSHSPSQSDLAQFNGFRQSSKHIDIDSSLIIDISGFGELRRGDVLATGRQRSLREIAGSKRASPNYRAHRKIAGF